MPRCSLRHTGSHDNERRYLYSGYYCFWHRSDAWCKCARPRRPFEEEPEIFEYPQPNKKFQETAFDYIPRTSRAAQLFVQAKVPKSREHLLLYLQEINLQEWQAGSEAQGEEAPDYSWASISQIQALSDTDQELL